MTRTIPTVDDLRIKLCYICREEEYHDDIPNPPRAWTHPCQCTLIAHEQCLLKWIQTSQATSVRAANALKCPQCGAQYQLESQYPILLKILSRGNKVLQKLGRLFTLLGIATFVGVVGSGIYIILTGYGTWALKRFIGKEMFDLLLTDDPANWSWTAYLNLPLLPLSLILSRLQTDSRTLPAIIPMLLVWPPSPPVGLRQQLLREYWTDPANAKRLALTALPPTRAWPPSPFAFGLFFVPLARGVYRILYARLAVWVLGARAASLVSNGHGRGVVVQGGRRGAGEQEREGEEQQQQQQEQGQLQDQDGQQVVWQWNGFGPLALRIRANVREVVPQRQQEDLNAGQPQQNGPPNDANPNLNPNDNPLEPGENPNPAAAIVEAAEQQIQVNTTSLGRQIGGALLIPAISSWMGSLLFRMSRYSRFLRDFLGIRMSLVYERVGGVGVGGPVGAGAAAGIWAWWKKLSLGLVGGGKGDPSGGGWTPGLLLLPPPPLGPWSYRSWDGLTTWDQIKLAIKLTLSATWGGTRTWAESDPVWWRNSIGLGLFVVAKDCLQLLHLWLTKRELETRRVKNRDFSGVDATELDLIPSWATQ